MAFDQNPQEKKEINDFVKFTMFANLPNSQGKKSILRWSIRDDNPRISVFTNDPNENNKQTGKQAPPITAAMNPETFFGFLDLFQKTIAGENNVKYKLECWSSYGKDNGADKQEKTLSSEVWFGKDENGICWLSLISASRPKIRFNFTISDYHRIFKQDGNPFTDSEASMLQANAVIKALREIYMSKMGAYREKYVPGDNASNTSKKYNTTSNSASETFSEDIPF